MQDAGFSTTVSKTVESGFAGPDADSHKKHAGTSDKIKTAELNCAFFAGRLCNRVTAGKREKMQVIHINICIIATRFLLQTPSIRLRFFRLILPPSVAQKIKFF